MDLVQLENSQESTPLLNSELSELLGDYARAYGVSFSQALERAVWELLYKEQFRKDRFEVEAHFDRDPDDLKELTEKQSARTEGIHYQSITLRTSKEQKHLVDFAAKRSRLSIQKLVEHIVFSEIEEAFGAGFDEYRKTTKM